MGGVGAYVLVQDLSNHANYADPSKDFRVLKCDIVKVVHTCKSARTTGDEDLFSRRKELQNVVCTDTFTYSFKTQHQASYSSTFSSSSSASSSKIYTSYPYSSSRSCEVLEVGKCSN